MPPNTCLECFAPLYLFKVLERRKKYDWYTKNRFDFNICNVVFGHYKKNKKIKDKNRRWTLLGGLCHHTDNFCHISKNNLFYIGPGRRQIPGQYSLSDNNRHAPYQAFLYEHTDVAPWKQGGESGSGDGAEGEGRIIENMLNIIRMIKKLCDRYFVNIDVGILVCTILSIYLMCLLLRYSLYVLTYWIKVFLVLVQH